MKLQNKLLSWLLPLVATCLLAVGWWSIHNASESIHDTARKYLRGVLSTYEQQVLLPHAELLKKNNLDKVPSFVRSYQGDAAKLVTDIPLLWPGHVFIVGPDGLMICSEGHNESELLEAWSETLRSMRENGINESFGHQHAHDREEFYFAIYFSPWDWLVVASVDDAALNVGLKHILAGTTLGGLSAVCLLALITALTFRKLFLMPITQLRRAATQIARHNFIDTIPISSNDELGTLARDMERMSMDLKKGHDQLLHWSEELEKEVDVRTAELESNNKLLQQEMETRKAAQDALAETLGLYQFLVDGTSDLVTLVDSSGTFIHVNPTGQTVYGCAPEDLVGRKAFDFVHPDDREQTMEAFASWVENKERNVSFENRNIGISGRVRDMLWAISLKYDDHGDLLHVASIAKDVTEAKRAERQLKEYSEKLERSNQEIKSFAYIVSHDLRAPLVNLKGFVAELGFSMEDVNRICSALADSDFLDAKDRETLRLALDEDIPEAMGFISSAVGRMDTLIESILKLSRLGRLEFELEEVDVNALVDEIMDGFSHQVNELGTGMRREDLPSIVADRTSIEQIFSNLLGNAVKYLDPERPGVINVSGRHRRGHTEFHVQDNGLGIPRDSLNRVFEPFRRVGPVNVPGEGMGLAYVQTIIRRYGGDIWCESAPGKGSIFSFTIPNVIAKQEDKPDD